MLHRQKSGTMYADTRGRGRGGWRAGTETAQRPFLASFIPNYNDTSKIKTGYRIDRFNRHLLSGSAIEFAQIISGISALGLNGAHLATSELSVE